MNPAEVYLKAAELVEGRVNCFPCTAVYSLDGVKWTEPESLARRFILAMVPGREAFFDPYNASQAYLRKVVGRLRSHSVLALCFMAAMEAA